jgi:regulator of sigma E protease
MSGFVFTVAILFLVLGVLVFVHELGHYWAAKAFGVWVHRFAVGIGKPIKKLSFQRGETEWAVAWLPIGGYVKMASREEDPSASVLEGGPENAIVPPDRVFEAKPVWQRMVIILAGVTFNVAFAWLIFTSLAFQKGRQYDPTTTIGAVNAELLPDEAALMAEVPAGTRIVRIGGKPVSSWDDVTDGITNARGNAIAFEFEWQDPITVELHRDALVERMRLAEAIQPMHPAVIGTISPNYPAADAGLEVGDSIVAVDGSPVNQWSRAVTAIQSSPDREITIRVIRAGASRSITVTPVAERLTPGDTTTPLIGRIGASVRTPILSESYSFGGALAAGTKTTWVAAGTIVRTFRGLLTGRVSTKEVGGPILIGQMAAQSARAGVEYLLGFMALISVNLAVVNLLPIPVLDGGAFLLLAIEGIIRRPIPVRLRESIQMIGLAMVVLLMVLAFSNDIRRLLGW